MGGDVIGSVNVESLDLKAKLGYRRSRVHRFEWSEDEMAEVRLVELTAGEAASIWGEITEAELGGRVIDAYMQIVLLGARSLDGDRLFSDFSEVQALPARLVVPMAQAIMDLTDLGIDSGKDQGDPIAPSPIA